MSETRRCEQPASPLRTDWLCTYHGKIADGLIDGLDHAKPRPQPPVLAQVSA